MIFKSPIRWVFFILFTATILIIVSLYFLNPELEGYFTEEDLFIENISALLFLSSGIYFVYLYSAGRFSIHKKVIILLAGLGFLCFFEEIGFGDRMDFMPMPEIGGGKVDGFHDAFSAIYLKSKLISQVYLIIFSLILFSAAILIAYKWRGLFQKIIKIIFEVDAYFFLFVCVSLVLTATILDIGIFHFSLLKLFEELLEMSGGLALLFSAIAAREPKQELVSTK